ncbi:MAG: flagellar biosynthetic protein FliO [Cellvibrionaceae bacterium]
MIYHKRNYKNVIKKHVLDFLIALFVMMLLIVSSSTYAESVRPISSANNGYIFQVFVGLIIIIAMIFGVAALAKRFGAGTMLNNQHLKIVSTLSLGQKEKIVIIEAGEQQLLLGITSQQVTNLHTFDESVIDLKTKKEMSDFTHKIHGFLKQQISPNNSSSQEVGSKHQKIDNKKDTKKDEL